MNSRISHSVWFASPEKKPQTTFCPMLYCVWSNIRSECKESLILAFPKISRNSAFIPSAGLIYSIHFHVRWLHAQYSIQCSDRTLIAPWSEVSVINLFQEPMVMSNGISSIAMNWTIDNRSISETLSRTWPQFYWWQIKNRPLNRTTPLCSGNKLFNVLNAIHVRACNAMCVIDAHNKHIENTPHLHTAIEGIP